jgi:L-iditol 2-dehydrogenase
MQALLKLSHRVGDVALREVPEPVTAPGQVKIAIKATGICGTDIHHVADEYPSRPPVILGHECAGQVVEVGAGVVGVNVGDRVTAIPFAATCGHCRYCREGELGLCPERVAFGSFMDGAFAEFMVIPATAVLPLPDSVDYAIGALTEPLANGVKATYESTSIQPRDRVLVTGPGPIGLLAALLSCQQGAFVVLVGTASDAGRLELARRLGIDRTLEAGTDDVPQVVRDLTGGEGVDILFECAGAAAAVRDAFPLVRKRGQITQLGLIGRPVELPYDQIVLRDIRVVGSFGNSRRSWEQALNLMRDSALPLAALISAVLPLSEWEKGFDMVRRQAGLKVLLTPDTN